MLKSANTAFAAVTAFAFTALVMAVAIVPATPSIGLA